MPGREPPAHRGAQTSVSARRVAAPYASRRPPDSHAARPGLAGVQCSGAAPPTAVATASRSDQRSPIPAEGAPACPSCAACLKASQEVLRAYNALLLNSKQLFIDDALHHYSGDEAWIRVLRSLGWFNEGTPVNGAGRRRDVDQK
ncbi:hypothetical protein, conserved [Leishmania lindenbergi]|uniref:Uncharacterized protein n=1 Tax=Leishmania lindenbergi TaxID=651832 RepID=A0AAW3AHA6_9TRYP